MPNRIQRESFIMTKPRISIIVAMDEERGIGKGDELLFKISEDFKRMQKLTTGHPILLGRKTFESKPLRRILPNRSNIIITRDSVFDPHKFCSGKKCDTFVGVAHSLDEALQQAKGKPGDEEVFIFGGGQVFKEALERGLVDRLYATLVKGDFHADTFFPDYSSFTKVISKEEREADGYEYTFLLLEKA